MTRSKYDKDYVKDMMNKVDSEKGRQVYLKRMGIVEPVFANICYASPKLYYYFGRPSQAHFRIACSGQV